MHNLDIDKLLHQLITTSSVIDEDNNTLDHIDEHSFFTLTDTNRLLVSVWYLINILTDHTISTTNEVTVTNDLNITNLNDLVDNIFNTKVTNDINVNLNSNEVKLADNKVVVDNLNTLTTLLLRTKLEDSSVSINNYNDLINALLTKVLNAKISNFNELAALTLNTRTTNFNDLTSLLLTTKISNLDELVTKLNNLTVQTTNALKPVVLTDNVINSIEVTNYSNATYQLIVTGLVGSFSINVLGSLDNTNWFTLPLMTSSLNITNNAVLVSSNSTIMLNVNCNCKFIKLNVMSLPLLTRIDAKLYLK